jgi:hypothetical protein
MVPVGLLQGHGQARSAGNSFKSRAIFHIRFAGLTAGEDARRPTIHDAACDTLSPTNR